MTKRKIAAVAAFGLVAVATLLHLTAGMADATTPTRNACDSNKWWDEKSERWRDSQGYCSGGGPAPTTTTLPEETTSTTVAETPASTTTTTVLTDPASSHDEGVAPVAVRASPRYTG